MTGQPLAKRSESSRVDRPCAARRQQRFRFLRLEPLEPRFLLSGTNTDAYDTVSAAWFEKLPLIEVLRSAPAASVASATSVNSSAAPVEDKWIIRLTEAATAAAGSVQPAEHLLDTLAADFQVLRGLGLPGQVLVRSFASDEIARAALADNPHVAAFEPERIVSAQVLPDDPDFPSMANLHNVGQFGSTSDADIDAPEAWDMNTGSPGVVVGVIDSGIDVTHPDLCLNIWLNQGEITATLKSQLNDTDVDGRITFYDLNRAANAALVTDFNGNGYIDAIDLLEDARWADGRDTDRNGFVDDFFGWNFRVAADEPFVRNDPRDVLGHGTHVAGTIGAIGNNGRGVTGVNWRSSLMALKFLGAGNQGLTSDAVLAVNYATMMRTQQGENVRVLNASWGQSGGSSPALRTAIASAGQGGLLLVAAAGNGNILGQGIDIDAEPFYPASYDLDNLLTVAATGPDDELARFSNYGLTAVDLAAPGVGVLSTLPGGRYGSANGTSMAAPHVAGTAAIVWSEVEDASVAEVRKAILEGANRLAEFSLKMASGARLNARGAIASDEFAPRATLAAAPDVTTAGASFNAISVRYTDRQGVDVATIDDNDLRVTNRWGPDREISVTLDSVDVRQEGREVLATYHVPAPDGDWGPLDYGDYEISLLPCQVAKQSGLFASAALLGSFQVKIADGTVMYVDSFDDAPDAEPGDGSADDGTGRATLRAAIQEANAAGSPRTIILDPGPYTLRVAGTDEDSGATGDLDICGSITIVGDEAQTTQIDAAGLDRVFEIHAGASLNLIRATVTHGAAPAGENGGGILNRGVLTLERGIVRENETRDAVGAGVAVEAGQAAIVESSLLQNTATDVEESISLGGGLYVGGGATVSVQRSTIAYNRAARGAGIAVQAGGDLSAENTTVSHNLLDGVWVDAQASAWLSHLTVVENEGFGVKGPAQVGSSMVFGQLGGGIYAYSRFSVVDAFSLGHNLIEFGDGAESRDRQEFSQPGDIGVATARFLVGPLQDNGGPTETHMPLPPCPGIDAAAPSSFPLTDQRGIARPQDGDGRANAAPDIGAVERFEAQLSGVLFHDLDGDGEQDVREPGLDGRTVFLDADDNGLLDEGEPRTVTGSMGPDGTAPSVAGAFSLSPLSPGSYRLAADAGAGWRRVERRIERVSVGKGGREAEQGGCLSSISGDGRFVAFVSSADNLVPGDQNGTRDVFLYDLQNRTIEKMGASTGSCAPSRSLSNDGRFAVFGSPDGLAVYDRQDRTTRNISAVTGGAADGTISSDGRFVAFVSEADNLVPGDENGFADVFVYDLQSGVMERVSVASSGTPANSASWGVPSISGDGRFVAFVSLATNLVPGDENERTDVFVYDRREHTVERVTADPYWDAPYEWAGEPAISEDGRFLAFVWYAQDDWTPEFDVFVYDRQNQTMERIGDAQQGAQANWRNMGPAISGDGRFVAFSSLPASAIPGAEERTPIVLVYDRLHQTFEQAAVAGHGDEANFWSDFSSISTDGRFIAFVSLADNLVADDTNQAWDVFVSRNSALQSSTDPVDLFAGQILEGVAFAITPQPGTIRGSAYQDLLPNGARDQGETGQEGIRVYLDANANGQFDNGERSSVTDAGGNYTFAGLRSEAQYRVGVVVPEGFTLVLPTVDEQGVWRVFLPAGGTITGRDFGLRPSETSGQFEDAVVDGIVFVDLDGDGSQDAGEPGLAAAALFLDLDNDGVRDFDEPRTLSASDDPGTPAVNEAGWYSFEYLGNRPYTVRILEVPYHQQTTPVGNSFERQAYSLAVPGNALGSPQDVAVADFDGDGVNDLATAVFERNSVALLLNDGSGAFPQTPVEIPLAPADRPPDQPRGFGPVALLAADFNASGQPDLAVVNNTSSNVGILLDFNGADFASEVYVPVGLLPNAVSYGDVEGDGDLDLVVTNEFDNRVSILRNNGQGSFTADAATPAVGNHPFGVATGDFNQDGRMDLAVADYGTHPTGGDLGDVRVLLADGSGGFTSHTACDVGFGPAALVADDLDGDGHLDLAVANFLSDNVTVCRGGGDGTFTAVATLPGGSGPMDIDAVDIEGDGDLDLLVTNGKSQTVGILRNRLSQGAFEFEPAESFGVANFPGASQISLATGDLDGNGTVDIALANSQANSVAVHLNTLVAGAHRVALTGTETVTGLDFGLQPLDTSLKVSSFGATKTGFAARFNRDLAAGVLNLYDQGGVLGPADVTVAGAAVGPVRGSLVLDPGLRKITFIRTGGPLEADTYTVTLFSGANAFRDTAGNLLDGNGDGTAGDNYTATFVVPSPQSGSVTVSLPDFARGYGQSVNLPANDPVAGLPLQVSNGLGVSRLQFTLRYDPSLLEVQAFTLSSSLAERGAHVQFQVTSPGEATLDVTAGNGFAAASGPLTVGAFTTTVPATALYGGKHVLDITELHVFDTSSTPTELPSVDDDAIHVAAFFGDTNGSRTYNAPDVTLNQRLIGLINTGLSAYQLADPLLLGDITRNGQLQANDMVGIQRLIGQVPVANVPALPTFPPGFTPPAASGADPRIYIPQDLAGSPGDTVTVPVRMHVTEPAGITLSGFDLVIEYDPARLTVTDAQIGPLLTGIGFVGSRLQLAPGVLIYTAGSGKPPEQLPVLPFDQNGDIVTLTVTILEGAAPGPAAVNLRASYTGTDTRTTAAFDRDLNELVLSPPPTNGPNDSVDGLLNVFAVARLDVPQDLTGQRGQSVTVPVRMTVTEPAGTTISGFDVVAVYDPSRFTLAGFQPGTLFSPPTFSVSLTEPVPGTVIYNASYASGTPLLPQATQADLFTLSLTVNLDAPLGVSPINLLESSGGTTTALYNNDLETLSLYPLPMNGPSDSVDGLVIVEDALTLIVTRVTPTTAGFVAEFNRDLGISSLNLYDGAGGELGPSDAILQDGSGNPVPGSLVLGSNLRTVEFVKTGSPLAPGDYTVLLKSGSAAFRDAAGNLLDGNRNGTPGDDFTMPLTVAAVSQRVLSVPDFARGAGQPVHVPASATGLPVRISSADAVTSVAVHVVFEPALLQITAAALAASVPGDWSVTRFDTSTAGVAKLTVAGTTPLSGSDVEIVRLAAVVPNAAPYGASQAIRLEAIAVNGGTIAAAGDVAVHKAAYLGDADGSGIHSSADAFLTVQAALGLASGFAAHAWTDPRIVGDADGSGVLSAADAFLIVQEGLGLPEPFVPDNPHITVTHVTGGIDPRFQIPVDIPATASGWVTVPVQLDIEPAADNVGAIEFEIFFDPSRLTIAVPEGILAGADTVDHWAISATPIAAGHVRISMLNAQGQALAAGLREIARLVFRVDAAATEGFAALDIEPWDAHAGGFAWTDSDGSLWIGPARPAGGHNPADPQEVNGDGETRVHDAALCRLLDQQDEQRGAREEDQEQADELLWGLLAEDLLRRR